MPRYLIEVAHQNKKEDCKRAVKIFLSTGSHFVTNADWGCSDGVHKAWIIVDLSNKEEALSVVPPAFRHDTTIVTLQNFSLDHAVE